MLTLKIGRNEYAITKDDSFMDNGSCVQLLTQSKEPISWGRQPHPVLSKIATKEIKAFPRMQNEHSYGDKVQVFSLSAV